MNTELFDYYVNKATVSTDTLDEIAAAYALYKEDQNIFALGEFLLELNKILEGAGYEFKKVP